LSDCTLLGTGASFGATSHLSACAVVLATSSPHSLDRSNFFLIAII